MTNTTTANEACFAREQLLKAQKLITNPNKDSINPHFKNKYASLEETIDVCKSILMDHGFIVGQECDIVNGIMKVETVFIHTNGELFRYQCAVPVGKMDPQGGMSAFTYGRRYGLKAALCLADEDDDAEIATIPVTKPALPAKIVEKTKNPFSKE